MFENINSYDYNKNFTNESNWTLNNSKGFGIQLN